MPRPRRRYFVKGAVVVALLAVFALLSAGGMIWAAGSGSLPFDATAPTAALLTIWTILTFISVGLVVADYSYVTPTHRHMQPYEPPDDEVARVLVYENSEFFIWGKPDQTLRKALLDDWFLGRSLKKRDWHVVDSQGIDVTDKTFLEFEGTVRFLVN